MTKFFGNPTSNTTTDLGGSNPFNVSGGGKYSDGGFGTEAAANSVSLSSKRVIHEFNIRFPDYDAALALSGDSTFLFPQGMDIFEDRIYIVYGGGGNNDAVGWIAIYDATTFEYVSCFRYTDRFGEGVHIQRDGSSLFMWARYNVGSDTLGKFDVTSLPPSLSTLSPDIIYPVAAQSMVTGDKNALYVQLSTGQDGIRRRNKFGVYDFSGNFICNKVFNEEDFGSISDEAEQNKAQAISVIDGGFVAVYGGTHTFGNPDTVVNRPAIRLFSDMCDPKSGDSYTGDGFIQAIRDAGYEAAVCEYEAVTEYNGTIVSLVATGGPTNTLDGGLLLIQEGSREGFDFSPALMRAIPSNIREFGNRKVIQGESLTNPTDGSDLTSLSQIAEYMRQSGTSCVELYTTGTTLNDFAGSPIGAGKFVRLTTGNSFTWSYSLETATVDSSYWVTRNGFEDYTQVLKA